MPVRVALVSDTEISEADIVAVIAGFFTGGALAIRGGRRAAFQSAIMCGCLLAVIEGVGIGFQRMMADQTKIEVGDLLDAVDDEQFMTFDRHRAKRKPLQLLQNPREHPWWLERAKWTLYIRRLRRARCAGLLLPSISKPVTSRTSFASAREGCISVG